MQILNHPWGGGQGDALSESEQSLMMSRHAGGRKGDNDQKTGSAHSLHAVVGPAQTIQRGQVTVRHRVARHHALCCHGVPEGTGGTAAAP